MTQPRKSELEKRLEAEAAKELELPKVAEEAEESDGPDVEALAADCEELTDQLLRARAEFDNYRKRMAREAERVRKTAAEGIVRDLLPVLDHLELALVHRDDGRDALADGVEMVLKQFLDVLRRRGVEPIPAKGEPFDPNVHEAVMQRQTDEDEPNMVLEEFQKGYRLGDLVLRPSKVIVSGEPALSAPAASRDSADSASPDDPTTTQEIESTEGTAPVEG